MIAETRVTFRSSQFGLKTGEILGRWLTGSGYVFRVDAGDEWEYFIHETQLLPPGGDV